MASLIVLLSDVKLTSATLQGANLLRAWMNLAALSSAKINRAACVKNVQKNLSPVRLPVSPPRRRLESVVYADDWFPLTNLATAAAPRSTELPFSHLDVTGHSCSDRNLMRRVAKLPFTLLFLTLLALPASREVSASTILWYEGTTYTTVNNNPYMTGEYTTSMRVTGWIEVADPLGLDCVCSFTSGSDDLLGFKFFDGVQFHEGGDDADFFTFTTNSAGEIVGWNVFTAFSLGDNAPVGGSDVELSLSSVHGDRTFEFCDNCASTDPWGSSVWHGASTTHPGRWTVVPEPSSLSLLLIGVAAVRLRRGRRLPRA